MMSENGCPVTINYGHGMEDVVGKFEVATMNPKAQVLWEMFRKNPLAFRFEIAYLEKEDGSKELLELSIVPAGKR